MAERGGLGGTRRSHDVQIRSGCAPVLNVGLHLGIESEMSICGAVLEPAALFRNHFHR